MEEVRDLLEADAQKSKEVFIREDQNGTTGKQLFIVHFHASCFCI